MSSQIGFLDFEVEKMEHLNFEFQARLSPWKSTRRQWGSTLEHFMNEKTYTTPTDGFYN
jgi:hypothetical protein